MPAPKGNNYNTKYKTSEERQELCNKVVAHLEQGYDQKTFPDCDWDTVERYMEEYPEDFPSIKINEAKRTGWLKLEKIGHAGMLGGVKSFNVTAWIFIMKNKMGWKDRTDITSDDEKVEGPIIYVPEKNKE